MKIKSKLYLNEVVENTIPRINSDKQYFCVYLVFADGSTAPAMFTDMDIQKAKTRAEKNTEDMPKEHKSFLKKLFG